jgi:fumarate hydratase class II
MAKKPSAKTRTESDAFGPLEIPADKFWGAQTERSLHNFRIGSERMPIELVHALSLIKRAAVPSTASAQEQLPSWRTTSPMASSTTTSRCWSGKPAPAHRRT